MQVKSTRSWCVLVEYGKENFHARFHNLRYHMEKPLDQVHCYTQNIKKALRLLVSDFCNFPIVILWKLTTRRA